jgi:tol-pal system protein YbgF
MQGEYEMKIRIRKKEIYFTGWVILLIAPFLGSCATDEKFAYTNDQINSANKRIASLEESVDKTIDKKLSAINSNQASLRLEINQLKTDISGLSGRVEENENLVKHSLEKDLTSQDTLRNELTGLSSKVANLEASVAQQQRYLNMEETQPEGGVQEKPETAAEQEGAAQDSGEQFLYDSSLAQFNDGQFNESMSGFKGFLEQYPKSDLADNAQFWIGECLMGLNQYEEAIVAFQVVIEKYPKGNKVPNAMLRQAIAFLELNDKKASKALLNQVIKKYPKSSEAKVAQKKLDTIK